MSTTAPENEVRLDKAKAAKLLQHLIEQWREANPQAKGGVYAAIKRGELPYVEMLQKALGISATPDPLKDCRMSDEDVLEVLQANPIEKGSATIFGSAVAQAQREMCAQFVEAGVVAELDSTSPLAALDDPAAFVTKVRKTIADAMRLEKKS